MATMKEATGLSGRLSVNKNYCLCISDTTVAEDVLQKKVETFVKKRNGTQLSAAEYGVLANQILQ